MSVISLSVSSLSLYLPVYLPVYLHPFAVLYLLKPVVLAIDTLVLLTYTPRHPSVLGSTSLRMNTI